MTGSGVPPQDKALYDPERARRALADDVEDFVATLMRRFADIEATSGSPGLVVAGYDTELFGHWWHEGVDWLEQLVLRLAAENVTTSTLAGALDRHPPTKPVYPERGSWGLGKGLDVWEGPAVAGMLDGQRWAQRELTHAVAAAQQGPGRDPWLDALAEEVLLTCASYWPFMVSHDSSPHYARSRLDAHLAAVDHRLHHRRLTDDDPTHRPFGSVDARLCRGG